jgi:hypothetical protein
MEPATIERKARWKEAFSAMHDAELRSRLGE